MMLKLYYWSLLDSIGSYTPGHAFALAEAKEQAIEMIVINVHGPSWKSHSPAIYQEVISELLDELNRVEPLIIDKPAGFGHWGSD